MHTKPSFSQLLITTALMGSIVVGSGSLSAQQCATQSIWANRIVAKSTYLPRELSGFFSYTDPGPGVVPTKYKTETWSGTGREDRIHSGGSYWATHTLTGSWVFSATDFTDSSTKKIVSSVYRYADESTTVAELTEQRRSWPPLGPITSPLWPPIENISATEHSPTGGRYPPDPNGEGTYIVDNFGRGWWTGTDYLEGLSDEFTEQEAIDRAENFATLGSSRLSFANDFSGEWSETNRTDPVTFHAQRVEFKAEFDQTKTGCAGDYTIYYHYYKWAMGSAKPSSPNYVETGSLSIEPGEPLRAPASGWHESPMEIGMNYEIAKVELMPAPNCPFTPGTGGENLNSVDAWFSLGSLTGGASAGMLQVKSSQIDETLYTPEMLIFGGPTSAEVTVIRDDDDFIRQVIAPEAIADVVTVDADTYEVRFYLPSQLGTQDPVTLIYALSGSPYVTHRIENPDVSPTANRLQITEIKGAQSEATIYTQTGGVMEMSKGNGQRVETVEEIGTAVTRTVKDSLGTVISTVKETYSDYSWGRSLSMMDEGVGQDTFRRTTYEYYDSGPSYSRLKKKYDESGGWEIYEYDAEGRLTKTTSQFLNTYSHETGNRETTTTYGTLVDQDGDGTEEKLITTVQSRQNQEIGRFYDVYFSKLETVGSFSVATHWSIQATLAGAAWDAATNLVTKTREIEGGDLDGRLISQLNPDQTLTTVDYTVGVSSITSTTRTGAPNVTLDAVVDGTRTVKVETLTGKLSSNDQYDIVSGLLLSSEIVTQTDDLGRATRIDYLDGTYETRSYACCGLDSITDRQGITTTYTYDGLGQVETETRAGITTQYSYDAEGQLLTVKRIGSDLSEITLETHAYDVLGRRISSKDAMNRETTFNENRSGVNTKTTKTPDNGTIIETFAEDGTLIGISGTAATAQLGWGYGVDLNGTITNEVRMGPSGETTEWTKTYTDIAGRVYKVETADGAFSEYFYNSLGQLVKQVDPDGVTTLFAYNARGEQEYVAIDLNQNGLIDFSGTDRITKTERSVVTAHSTTVQKVTTTQWTTDNVATTEVVSTIESDVDGTEVWQTIGGLTTHIQTSYGGSGARTETTTGPDGTVQTRQYQDDRLTSEVISNPGTGTLSSVSYTYDPHGRLATATDLRNGTTTYTYYDDDQLHTVITPDPDTGLSGTGYDAQTTIYDYDTAGRLWYTAPPDSGVITNEYYPNGLLKKTAGTRTYPVEYTYDTQGRLKTLKTWKDFIGDTGSSLTTWNYDTQRGWLISKRYEDNQGPNYTYFPSGRLKTRTWARGITTTYGYDNAGGLLTVAYSDTTPDVSYSYDRRGRVNTFTDAAGVLTRTYDLLGQLDDESYAGTGVLTGQVINRGQDALYRLSSVSIPSVVTASYSYDAASRLQTVTNGNRTSTYGYLVNSTLVETLTHAQSASNRLITTNVFDKLNRLASISNSLPVVPSTLSHTYAYNDANQRVKATREDSRYWEYGYDSLGQVINADKFLADTTLINGLDFDFTYDDIGNRQTALRNGRTAAYTANALNQYANRTVPGAIDVIGTANENASITVNDGSGTRQTEAFLNTAPLDNSSSAVWNELEIVGVRNNAGAGGEDAVVEETRNVFLPQTPENYTYDVDGNLLSDGRWIYTWDGENRLIVMETPTALVTPNGPLPVIERKKLEFTYDAQSRRIEKKVSVWNDGTSSYQLSTHTLFLYDGWNLLAELDALNSNATLRSYTWGLDLSGSAQGAGGVGGLLSLTTSSESYFISYDGNGNVIGLVDATTGTLSAEYEYGPFGEVVKSTGTMATANLFQFSTKYRDDETGLLYYGYRYYNSDIGRWLNRDPIDENGGLNVYGFTRNNGVDNWDLLGLSSCSSASDVGNIDLQLEDVEIINGTQNFDGTPEDRLNDLAKKVAKKVGKKGIAEIIETAITQTSSLVSTYKARIIIKYRCCECVCDDDSKKCSGEVQWSSSSVSSAEVTDRYAQGSNIITGASALRRLTKKTRDLLVRTACK